MEYTTKTLAAVAQATEAFDKMHDAQTALNAAKRAVREASEAADVFRAALKALPFNADKEQAMTFATVTSLDLRAVSTNLDRIEVIK